MADRLKVVVLGGTFDPIHFGHLRLAEVVMESEKLDKILFVPSYRPPFKDNASPFGCRADMVARAIYGNDRFMWTLAEKYMADNKRKTYTYSMIKKLQSYDPDWDHTFITGVESWREFGSWHKAFDLLGLCNFLFVDNFLSVDEEIVEDGPQEIVDQLLRLPTNIYNPKVEYQHPSGTIVRFVGAKTPEIRATDIRRLRQEGKSIRYLVPECVREYIEEEKLYLPEK